MPQLDASAQRRRSRDERFDEERIARNEWMRFLLGLKTEQTPYLIEKQVNLLLNIGPEVVSAPTPEGGGWREPRC